MYSGAAAVSLAQVAEQACVFARNIVLARLLGPDNMGVAATLAVTLSALEMTSNLAADRLLLQAKDGDEPGLQAAAQLVEALRGILCAVLIFALAGPIAGLFGVPEATGAYRWLAVVPILRGLVHLDAKRLVRGHKYAPLIAVDLGSQALATAAAWPLARATGDYTAALWLIIGQVTAYTAISHLVASRRYSWRMTASAWSRMLSFGWPLLINGLLMFGIFQGDRLIVGVFYDMTTLGVYSVAFSLAMLPTMMLARIATTMTLPTLSRSAENMPQFEKRYRLATSVIVTLASAYMCLLVAAGGAIMRSVYGVEYAAGGPLLSVLAGMQALRMLRIVPTIGAMAFGDTQNSMVANIWRTAAIPLALLTAALGAPVLLVAMAGVVGELLANVVSIHRLARRQGIVVRSSAPGLAVLIGLSGGFALAQGDPLAPWGPWVQIVGAAAVSALAGVATAAALRPVREELTTLIARFRAGRTMKVDSA